MQFRTPIPISESIFPIDYNSKIMSVGSCFAVNMAEKFNDFKFQNSCNPFGIIFNPVSIERLVERVVKKELFTENDIFFHNDSWHCFEVHSELSNPDK
ncbi:MAG TPA: GSCFA domain-containing protein, partial [Flavobacterium sp.]|nr:GSCFA domain-containing protein [Flavobacterium sp.]